MSPTKTKEAPPRPSGKPTAQGDAPAPTMTPQGGALVVEGAPAGPTLTPPGANGAGIAEMQAAEAGIAAWQSVTVGGLYATNNVTNCWAYLNGVGWRLISPANAIAHHNMLQILRLARDANLTVQCDEDGNVIHTVYVW
jgi:hypothetical protein